MTQEEKAKAYDKAIEKIKYVMEHGVLPVLNKEDLQDIFPELKESEDEKIRKGIIELVKQSSEILDRKNQERMLDWLEKQGEQKPKWTEEEIRETQLDYWRSVGGKEWHGVPVQETIAWLEKQAPKLAEEDEIGSDETIELLEYFINYAPEFRKPAIGRSIAWLKSIKQRLGGEE